MNRICKFYLQDMCFYGSECSNLHPNDIAKNKMCEILKNKPCIMDKCGKCTFGDKCIYSHEITEEKRLCLYNLKGECKYGDKCLFSHIKKDNNVICRYYLDKKICKNGDKCKFAHVSKENCNLSSDYIKTVYNQNETYNMYTVDVDLYYYLKENIINDNGNLIKL